MRNRALHDALRTSRWRPPRLTEELKAGAEVEFDVVDEGGGRGPALYRYEPRTGAFIEERWPQLRELPTAERERHELGARLCLAARERTARRAGRAGAAGDARAALRGRHQLRLPRGPLRARLRRGRAHALPRRGPRTGDRAGARSLDGRRARGLGDGPSPVRGDAPRACTTAPLSCACWSATVPADDPTRGRGLGALRRGREGPAAVGAGRVVLAGPGWRQADHARWQPVGIGSAG